MKNESSIPTAELGLDFYADSVLTRIDAEELCEFNFDFFLPELNHKLKKREFKLAVQIADDHEISHEIFINGRLVKLYNEDEKLSGKFWVSGPRNFFRAFNKVLGENNINKQFYLLYAGNDLSTVFLNEQQFESMVELNKDNEYEIPYQP